MKNSFIILLTIVLIVGVGFFVFKGSSSPTTAAVVNDGPAQEVTLGMKDYNYYPQVLTVNAGQPVRLTLDSSVSGCLRSFTIKELGVSKYAKTPQDIIEFTAPQKGTYKFTCSMGMGYGTLNVV